MMNKVILIGRLARDPETRNFQNGGIVCNLRVATSRSWKDRNSGERVEKTEWHTVAIFAEPKAKYAQNTMRKGDMVQLEGSLETRKWTDQAGQDRYSTEIVIRPFEGDLNLIPTGRGGNASGASGTGSNAHIPDGGNEGNDPGKGPEGGNDTKGGGGKDEFEDEIPF
jgi:single-strand DNA-binding protein